MTDKELRTLDEMLTNLEIWSTWNKTFANEMIGICSKMRNLLADRKTENCSENPNNSTISKMEQVEDEPKTQMETQNSNLTFKTLEYCDICDHKGCKECIANALDEHCIPSQFKKQIEDECAKEYEELGLKELKELIEADRKALEQTERI